MGAEPLELIVEVVVDDAQPVGGERRARAGDKALHRSDLAVREAHTLAACATCCVEEIECAIDAGVARFASDRIEARARLAAAGANLEANWVVGRGIFVAGDCRGRVLSFSCEPRHR